MTESSFFEEKEPSLSRGEEDEEQQGATDLDSEADEFSQGEEEDGSSWFKDAVIYELHVKAFYDSAGDGIGDFKGLTSKLDYLKDLGVTAIWLLPFYPSPLKDDGYDISDYLGIHQSYGTLKDFREFLRQAHSRGLKVITELVLNHTSSQHPWFQSSRRAPAGSALRDFYVWSDTPDKYKDARVIFSDFETSNWTWDTTAKAYYWHRFYSHQPDLNFDNPRTQKVMMEVVSFWLKLGVDGLRLDAVPYLFERDGTNCENLPETHEFLKTLRKFVDTNFKNRMLLAEANQWPTEAAAYFGNGDECQMAFHFPLMPRMFMAIQMEDRFPVVDILDKTPPIPDNCQWGLFLRNHDELTLEMVTDEERDYMYRVYGKDKQARINLGIRRRLAPLLDNDRRKIELMSVLLFTLPGTPIVYYGDEIGMGDNYFLGDRNGVRTPMQWSADINAGFSRTNPQRLYEPVIIEPKYNYEAINVENQQNDPSSLLAWMKNLISIKKHYIALRRGTIEFLFPDNWKILAFVRKYGDETVLVAVNLSKHPQSADLDLSKFEGCIPEEVFGGVAFPVVGKSTYRLTFSAYGYYVFSIAKPAESTASKPVRTIPELALGKKTQDLFRGKWKSKLEEDVLPSFLEGARWFGGKAKTIERISIRDVVTLETAGAEHSEPAYVTIVDVHYTEGLPEAYLLPIAYASAERSAELIEKNSAAAIAWITLDQDRRGLIMDAVNDPDFRAALLEMILRRRTMKGGIGELSGSSRPALAKFAGKQVEAYARNSRLLGADQSNTSMAFNDELIIKIFRRVEEGVNPEVEIGDALARESFANAPRLFGDISYSQPNSDEPITIGVLEEFVKNQGDSWSLFLLEFSKFLERVASSKSEELIGQVRSETPVLQLLDSADVPAKFAEVLSQAFLEKVELLGRRTAEFHLALSRETEDDSFRPEPFTPFYQIALSQSMTSYANRVLRLAEKQPPPEPAAKDALTRLLARQNLIAASFDRLRRTRIDAMRIRTHGDFHLAQVLYTGKDFVIMDFEGEPARSLTDRRLKRSVLKDIAGMMRSFHYAAYSTLLKQAPEPSQFNIPNPADWAEAWYKCVCVVFLRSYLRVTGGSDIIPRDREAFKVLLEAYLIEKAFYELSYELNNRPAWAVIPLRGISDLLMNLFQYPPQDSDTGQVDQA
jgi:maltose alpha-D-glucosyltransferase/alpha-amylase